MLPCVGEVQSCVRNSARLLPRICWSFARRRWTPTQLGQILLCQQHVDVATPEIRSLPGWIFEGTHSPEERDTVWSGATRWRSFWDTILELLPRCRAPLPRLGRRAQFATLSCFADEEDGQRFGKLHTHSPTSIQKRQARKRSVTVILAQRENPLIEISAILTQCDRALSWTEGQCCYWQWAGSWPKMWERLNKPRRLKKKRELEGVRRPLARTALCVRTARIARKDVNFEAPFGGLGSFSCKRNFLLEECFTAILQCIRLMGRVVSIEIPHPR